MSGASNLGYQHIYPNSNVNGEFVNKTGANYAGNFGSNQIPVSSHSLSLIHISEPTRPR